MHPDFPKFFPQFSRGRKEGVVGNEACGKTKPPSLPAAVHQLPSREGQQQPPWGRPMLTVHGHLVDLGGVVLLDVPQDADVVVLHEVDRYTFSPVSA